MFKRSKCSKLYIYILHHDSHFFTTFTIICFNLASQRKIRKMYKKNPPDFSLTLVLKSVITRNIMFTGE